MHRKALAQEKPTTQQYRALCVTWLVVLVLARWCSRQAQVSGMGGENQHRFQEGAIAVAAELCILNMMDEELLVAKVQLLQHGVAGVFQSLNGPGGLTTTQDDNDVTRLQPSSSGAHSCMQRCSHMFVMELGRPIIDTGEVGHLGIIDETQPP